MRYEGGVFSSTTSLIDENSKARRTLSFDDNLRQRPSALKCVSVLMLMEGRLQLEDESSKVRRTQSFNGITCDSGHLPYSAYLSLFKVNGGNGKKRRRVQIFTHTNMTILVRRRKQTEPRYTPRVMIAINNSGLSRGPSAVRRWVTTLRKQSGTEVTDLFE